MISSYWPAVSKLVHFSDTPNYTVYSIAYTTCQKRNLHVATYAMLNTIPFPTIPVIFVWYHAALTRGPH